MTALDQFTQVAVAAVIGAGLGALLVLMVQKGREITAREREERARQRRITATLATLAKAYADLAADINARPKP